METIIFGSFHLDPARRSLTRRGKVAMLRPKTLEVLLLLLRRAGDVVTKDEILATVWGGVAVSEYVLTTCVSELRAALGESSRQPRHLRTVHGTGYQFTAEVRDVRDAPSAGAGGPRGVATIVGRERELAQLQAALQRALAGQRQVVFITGEMGIGKTTLADQFLQGVAGVDVGGGPVLKRERGKRRTEWLAARGQCIEQFGAGEPYMPVLEAIGRLAREADGAFVTEVLRRHAPAWLIQIPGLLSAEERIALRSELPVQTQAHMLRLIAEGIEAISERHPLVLLLEDLHLSDHATLELVAALAMRRGPARLLIAGTFRNTETFAASALFESLKQQLVLHAQCEEIALEPLTRAAVDVYLATRFAGLTLPPGLGATIHGRTEGNPLFLARLVDQLLDDGLLQVDLPRGRIRLRAADIAGHVPRNLRAMIEQRTDALAAGEREILETASVAGVQFWSASVAAALGGNRESIEHVCADLSRRHGFLVVEEITDAVADLGARYRFCHALYQQVLYERIQLTRRQRLHRSIGTALREAWAQRADEAAVELASHFERGGDLPNAIEFYDKAAAAAKVQGANREAAGYLDHALALLDRTEDSRARRERQLDLLMTRGPAVLAASGHGSIAVLENYEQALDLARQLDDPMRQMSSLLAISICQQTRANLAAGEQLALELVRVAERVNLPEPLVAQLRNPLSQVRMYQGAVQESLALSDAAVAAMQILPFPPTLPANRPVLWADPNVMLYCQNGTVSFAAGRLAQAATAVEHALRIARDLHHPFNLAYASCFAALYEDTMGEWESAVRIAQQATELAHTHDFPFWEGIAMIFCGHARARSGALPDGLALLRQGIDLWRGTGGRLAESQYLNLLADACLAAGAVEEARAALTEAETHAGRTGEMVFLAETYRLQAECGRRTGAAPDEVDAILRRAITTARQQGTALWELRATLARNRHRPSPDSRAELAAICRVFDREPTARDVLEARAVLQEEGSPSSRYPPPRRARKSGNAPPLG